MCVCVCNIMCVYDVTLYLLDIVNMPAVLLQIIMHIRDVNYSVLRISAQ